jgi:hypothetical protein
MLLPHIMVVSRERLPVKEARWLHMEAEHRGSLR